MTLTGSVGRWHGGRVEGTSTDERVVQERALRNEIRRHREQLDEWRAKREEARVAIANHQTALRKLARQAARLEAAT
jgi:precorrin isomerase